MSRDSTTLPLDRAAYRRDLLDRTAARLCDLHHRVEQFARSTRGRLDPRGSIEAPAILQLKRAVVAEEIGSALRSEGPRDILCLIENIGKRVLELRRHFLHVLERILRVIVRIVRHDRDRADAVTGQLPAVPHDARPRRFDVRAVIADKYHEQTIGTAAGRQAVTCPVDPRKIEVGRFRAETGCGLLRAHEARRTGGSV